MASYPSECLRGIPSEHFIDNGLPRAELFSNVDKPKITHRTDGSDEVSITWRDEDAAVNLMFEQENGEGEKQFRYGIAIIRRSDLDILKGDPRFKGVFKYERKPTHLNKYHGNLLLKSDTDAPKRRMIFSLLAFYANNVIRRV